METFGDAWKLIAWIGSGLGNLLYDYQALVAGALAIVAAYIAAKPVWRQLEKMNAQTSMLFRDFLRDRIRITSLRRKWFAEQLGTFRDDVSQRAWEAEERGGSINVHWAFDQDQVAGRLLDDVRRRADDHRDPPAIESALEAVVAKLEALRNTLDAIHRTASMDQSCEDYSISDEDWAAMKAAALQAEADLQKIGGKFSVAVKRLDEEFAEELAVLRERMRQSDHVLMQAKV